MPRRLWLHGNMKGQSAGNQNHLWDEDEFRRRSKGMTKQAARELKRGMQRRRRGRR
jgi:hypothetical protein